MRHRTAGSLDRAGLGSPLYFTWRRRFAGGLAALVVTACDCSVEEIQRLPAPDGAVEAVMYQDNCWGGATTSPYSTVVLVERGSPLKNPAGKVISVHHAFNFQMAWTGDRELTIVYPSPDRAVFAHTLVGEVSIKYVTKLDGKTPE